MAKCGRARQATDDGKIRYRKAAIFTPDNKDNNAQARTQVHNTYCFATAAMVMRTRLSLRLYAHCLCLRLCNVQWKNAKKYIFPYLQINSKLLGMLCAADC
jgi:hypothetical protein